MNEGLIQHTASIEIYSGKGLRVEEGDQQRFWKLTRRFIEDLAQAYPGAAPRVRAVSRRITTDPVCK